VSSDPHLFFTSQMPNTKSAIKAMRQNVKRRIVNLEILSKIKKAEKAVRKNVTAGNLDEAKKALQEAFASLDKAAKKNVIHANNASRNKSRLSKLISKASAK
jgi:small subunit ribosomal protein S20